MKFEGIIPPAITPFHDDGSVDEPGHAAVIEYMIDRGVHAIIVGGTTGEYYALSREEPQFAQSVRHACDQILQLAVCRAGERVRTLAPGDDGHVVRRCQKAALDDVERRVGQPCRLLDATGVV